MGILAKVFSALSQYPFPPKIYQNGEWVMPPEPDNLMAMRILLTGDDPRYPRNEGLARERADIQGQTQAKEKKA